MTMAHKPENLLKPEREFAQIPITALAFYQPPSDDSLYVLAAEDTDIAVYDVTSRHLVFRQRAVLFNQPIHGIHAQAGGSQLLVWGSDSVVLLSADSLGRESPAQLTVLARKQAPDWIYDGAVSPYNSSSAVLVTAHNEVVRLTHDEARADGALLAAAVSPQRTMLFSAGLTWDDQDQVLVAAGTAFGEILIWRCRLEGSTATHEMLYAFTGHEGSIFDVDISPLLRLKDGSTVRMLASCSDDRTVRIWDIGERDGDPALVRSGVNSDAPHDTGFKAKTGQEARPLGLVALNMGHVSRIWGVRFGLENGVLNENGLKIYSFGEDATVQRWCLELDSTGGNGATELNGLTGRLSPERLFMPHDGKHIWSKARVHLGTRLLLATGGADGKVSLIEETTATPDSIEPPRTEIIAPADQVITMSVSDILKSLPSPKALGQQKDIINRYAFVTDDELLATTTAGALLLGKFTEKTMVWREVDTPEEIAGDIKNCYVMTKVDTGAALLGMANGNIYIYRDHAVSHVIKLPRKVFEIFRLCDSTQIESAEPLIEVLVFLHASSVGHLLTFDRFTGALRTHDQITSLDSRFVTVSATKIRDLLLIGSRHGWLSILKREGRTYRPVLDTATKSHDAISCMISLPSKSSSSDAPLYILVTTRDGMYRIYEVEELESSLRLHLRSETSPPLGPILTGAWFTTDPNPELLITGFRSNRFIVWNETKREELVSVESGGGPHRSFSLTTSATDPGCLKFAFTRASMLSVYRQKIAPIKSLKLGTHGREIRALSYNGRYLATGSEDTTIRIWEYLGGESDNDPEMRCVAYMKTHATGLQRLQWLGNDYLFSSAGNEEFFVWRVRRLDAHYSGVAVLCESVFSDKSAEGDLRIMDFDVCKSPTGDSSLIITLSFSNSVLKTYRYHSSSGFGLLAEAQYTGACLTQARHVDLSGGELTVLTASTDGHLALWRAELSDGGVQSYELTQVQALHQSSIKSLDMIRATDGYRVLTGGDDNAIGSARVCQSWQDETRCRYLISERGIVRRAHAAAVNGVVLREQSDGELVGVSVSNDQKVKFWKLGSGKMELLRDAYSGVADPGDVCLVEGGKRAFVAGVGIETWRLWD